MRFRAVIGGCLSRFDANVAHSFKGSERCTNSAGTTAKIPAAPRSQLSTVPGTPAAGAIPTRGNTTLLSKAGPAGARRAPIRNARVDLSRKSHGSFLASRRATTNAQA
jgi:hypothetical protein